MRGDNLTLCERASIDDTEGMHNDSLSDAEAVATRLKGLIKAVELQATASQNQGLPADVAEAGASSTAITLTVFVAGRLVPPSPSFRVTRTVRGRTEG